MSAQRLGYLLPAALLVLAADMDDRSPRFQTSDRCLACHNGLQTSAGEDVSIGYDWRASMMANSSRDPYWQASVRRESLDHPESRAEIEDECSVCHMPITRYEAVRRGGKGAVFEHLPFHRDSTQERPARDGVSCSVCHQISKRGLGTRESFNGAFLLDPPTPEGRRLEYGPFAIDQGRLRIMRSSTEGYQPAEGPHIRDSALCATCHTLYTKALGPGGKVIGELPEQMPYQEWLHSDYRDRRSCQSCHMPEVGEPVPVTQVLGEPRSGVRRHVFVGANFFMLGMLNRFRDELAVDALPQEMTMAATRTVEYLQSQAAGLRLEHAQVTGGELRVDVVVENRGGHKLPTAYPSRRAWLHLVVRDARRKAVFESGALNPDGSIRGNDNDSEPGRYEPHYAELRSPDHVQIYEAILGDAEGRVTTGLLTGVRYLKDNRLLPGGFDKRTAAADIAVIGDAREDSDFTGAADRVRYRVPADGPAPYSVEVELLYQPIGYRWAENLRQYPGAEAQRFNRQYDAMSGASTVWMARHAIEGIR